MTFFVICLVTVYVAMFFLLKPAYRTRVIVPKSKQIDRYEEFERTLMEDDCRTKTCCEHKRTRDE